MILMKTVLVLSMMRIQFAANAEEVHHQDAEEDGGAHHQDAEEIEYLKQLVKRLSLGQHIVLRGLIQSVEKQSSKIKGANEDVIQRIKYEVLQEAIEQVESLRELGLDDLDIEGIEWVTSKLTGATSEEDDIVKVLKGMSNQDLKILKKNIDGKLLHQDKKELLGVLDEMDNDEFDTFMENIHENDIIDKKASHLLKGQEQVLNVLEDMEEDELEAFIENMNENEVSDRNRNKVLSILDTDEAYLNGKINKVYDNEDIEQVINKMSDNELKVVLKNVEDQKLGEFVTSMNDQDFNEVMRNLQGDTEEISMARDIIEMIQSEELDTLTHQKLEQHSKELSQSRKRRDLNDVLRGNIDKTRRRREIKKGFQGFSSSDLPSTFASHQKLMANIVEKEKESRKRKRRATDILEKQKDNLRSGVAEKMDKEPTYLATNFEPERESEERKKSAGYIGLLSLYEHSRKRRHSDGFGRGDSDGFGSLGTRDRQKRNLSKMDWLFGPDTGHQAEPDTKREPYIDQSQESEDTQGDNGDHHDDFHHHPTTTISLGSNVHAVDTQYRTSAETSTTTKNNAPNEKLTISYGQESKDTQGHDLHHHPTTTISLGSNVHAVDTQGHGLHHHPTTTISLGSNVHAVDTQSEDTQGHDLHHHPTTTFSLGSNVHAVDKQSEDTQGHDLHHHPTTTISLGSNVHAVDTQSEDTQGHDLHNHPTTTISLGSNVHAVDTQSEDTQGHDLHHHPTTTISLGSNVHPVDTLSEDTQGHDLHHPTTTISLGSNVHPVDAQYEDTQGHGLHHHPTTTISLGSNIHAVDTQSEDTQGHDLHHHPTTTISLGSNVHPVDTQYRTSAETSTTTENNAPNEKLTLYGQESEDTQGHDLHHHPTTTISLGSNVHAVDNQYRTSLETSTTTTENNAANEKLTLKIGTPERIYFSHHTKPLKNSHIDTLKSVKFPYNKVTLSYGQELEDTQGDHSD